MNLTIREREIKLAVESSAAAALYDYLWEERAVGGLPVTAAEDLPLRDAYFDTADLVIWRTGGYLRLRREPQRSLVTLRVSRGSPLTPDTVESTRPMRELPLVIDELTKRLPGLAPLPQHASAPGPLLAEVGLHHVVSLQNERRVLSVQPESSGPRYRVKLDKVRYDTWTEPLHEIELDVYDRDGLAWAARVVDSLRSRAPGAVRVTTSTKLERGLVLRELYQVRGGAGPLDVGVGNGEAWWRS